MPLLAGPLERTPVADGYSVRELDPLSDLEIELVAQRMRKTLIEVEGEETGVSLYTLDWLRERVRWHLDPNNTTARIFLAERFDGSIAGHTIVRIEVDEQGQRYGLFSTTFVEPEARRHAVATMLLTQGEDWMIGQGLREAATWTSSTNTKLIHLYSKHGYTVVAQHTHDVTLTRMVKLAKSLSPQQANSIAGTGD